MTNLLLTLFSPAPAPDRADKLALYGQFAGDWRFEAETRRGDGPWQRQSLYHATRT